MNKIPIYLVVGFLGSGKTTLLKRLVHATAGRNFLFVVNEFSAVDVDAGQIEKEGGAAIAVAGGSIFCRCLISEFVSVMRRISEGVPVGGERVEPEGVVIEASGMADPRSMGKLLSESRLDNHYHVAGITAIVDPGVLMKLLLVLPNIRGQIQSADLIVFNKTDLHSPETVERVTEKVCSINPHAKILYTTFCDFDLLQVLKNDPCGMDLQLSADFNKCKDPHFESESFSFSRKPALAEVLDLFSGDLNGLYRVKGFVECLEGWFLVEWSEGGLAYHVTVVHPESSLTLIWNPEYVPKVIEKLRTLAG